MVFTTSRDQMIQYVAAHAHLMIQLTNNIWPIVSLYVHAHKALEREREMLVNILNSKKQTVRDRCWVRTLYSIYCPYGSVYMPAAVLV